jgi:RND family efflux transporter MFP subunit
MSQPDRSSIASWRRVGTAALVAAAIIGCGDHRPLAAPPVESAPARLVETVAVATSPVGGGSAAGTVSARQRATLAARLSATVRELPFEEGEAVRAGQVVVRLADDAMRSALAAAEADARSADSDRARFARLLERQAATPREAEATVARAAATAAAVAAAREALAYTALRAPFDGRLARRLVRQGDVVAPGQTLVEVEGAASFELRASIDASGAAALSTGDTLQAEVDGIGDPLAVTVRAVSRAGDPGTHRFEVVADFDAPPAALRSGAYARLLLPGGAGQPAEDAALTGPRAAVLERGGLTGVFVADQGVARLRWIAPGLRQGDRLAVRAGLKAGERVILEPAGLVDGAPIAEDPR